MAIARSKERAKQEHLFATAKLCGTVTYVSTEGMEAGGHCSANSGVWSGEERYDGVSDWLLRCCGKNIQPGMSRKSDVRESAPK